MEAFILLSLYIQEAATSFAVCWSLRFDEYTQKATWSTATTTVLLFLASRFCDVTWNPNALYKEGIMHTLPASGR
jgi:hypothetical protein